MIMIMIVFRVEDEKPVYPFIACKVVMLSGVHYTEQDKIRAHKQLVIVSPSIEHKGSRMYLLCWNLSDFYHPGSNLRGMIT